MTDLKKALNCPEYLPLNLKMLLSIVSTYCFTNVEVEVSFINNDECGHCILLTVGSNSTGKSVSKMQLLLFERGHLNMSTSPVIYMVNLQGFDYENKSLEEFEFNTEKLFPISAPPSENSEAEFKLPVAAANKVVAAIKQYEVALPQ